MCLLIDFLFSKFLQTSVIDLTVPSQKLLQFNLLVSTWIVMWSRLFSVNELTSFTYLILNGKNISHVVLVPLIQQMSQTQILVQSYLDWMWFYFSGQFKNPYFFLCFLMITVLNSEINWTSLLLRILALSLLLLNTVVFNSEQYYPRLSLCSLFVQVFHKRFS